MQDDDRPAPSRRAMLLGGAVAGLGAAALPRPAAAQYSPASLAPRPGMTISAANFTLMTQRANAQTLGVIAGGVDGTYIRIAADLAAVLDEPDRQRVLPMAGKGSLQNLQDVLFLRGVDVAIVQSDALAYVRRERLLPGVEFALHYIAKLYDEEFHLLARRDIGSVEELAGKKVNVDVRGSGTAITASLVFEGLGIAVQPQHDSQDTALEKLKQGEIAALCYVAGKPARLFTGIAQDSDVHLLPVPLTAGLIETYLPAQLSHADYPALMAEGEALDTIAVGAAMAVYAWPMGTERYRKLALFCEEFWARFARFRVAPRHPKWREVTLAAQIPGWTRFAPAQALAQPARAAEPPARPPQALSRRVPAAAEPGTQVNTQPAPLPSVAPRRRSEPSGG